MSVLGHSQNLESKFNPLPCAAKAGDAEGSGFA